MRSRRGKGDRVRIHGRGRHGSRDESTVDRLTLLVVSFGRAAGNGSTVPRSEQGNLVPGTDNFSEQVFGAN